MYKNLKNHSQNQKPFPYIYVTSFKSQLPGNGCWILITETKPEVGRNKKKSDKNLNTNIFKVIRDIR